MASSGGSIGGIGLGGILVIVGILVAIFWSVIVGVIIALVGLIAFGGFAKGKWYSDERPAEGVRREGHRPPAGPAPRAGERRGRRADGLHRGPRARYGRSREPAER